MHILEFAAEPLSHARVPAPTMRHGAASGDRRRTGMARMAAALRRACGPASPLLPAALAAAASFLLPAPARAHVKWFAAYDVAEPPTPVEGLLTSHFLLVFAGFALLVFGGFLLDRLASRSGRGGVFAAPGRREELEERLMRAGTGAFFMALFTAGGVILTPELKTGAEWPAWLQLGIAASMLSARSCALGAAGILALYGHGVARYGAFHLADYPIFLGLAAYLALTSCPSERLRALRMPALYVSLCVSLMWGAERAAASSASL